MGIVPRQIVVTLTCGKPIDYCALYHETCEDGSVASARCRQDRGPPGEPEGQEIAQ